jgi:hypothetical protein
MRQEFNPEIIKLINSQTRIEPDFIILFLIAVDLKLEISSCLKEAEIEAFNLGIINYAFNTTNITLPLYKEAVSTNWDWVSDWMDGFARINPDRKGTKSAVTSRMKKFFSENPEVRKDDVYVARDAYLSTVRDRQYLKSSHKFIYEGAGVSRFSMLEQYIEQTKSKPIGSDGRNMKMKG